MEKKLTTLCYIEKNGCFLMLHRVKKKVDVNKNKWIGVGGHFEENETPEECVIREVKEETGLCLTSYKLRGLITFICPPWPTEYMFLFTADQFTGELQECDEGNLAWIPKNDVHQLPLWEGDHIFLKLLETREDFFTLKLEYEGDKLVRHTIG